MTPLFSIITVTFNAEAEIDFTLKSIKEQSFTDYEHIVMDGASKDHTIEKIKSCVIDNQLIISEPDNGLYDAMNKAMKVATGEYLIFLNAGDSFSDKNALKRIAETAINSNADIVYGQTQLVDNKRTIVGKRHLTAPSVLSFKSFLRGMLVCHQAFIARRSIAQEYNLKYRFSADYEWCLRCLKQSRLNAYCDSTIINFLTGGTTLKNHKASLKERYNIMCRYYGTIPTIIMHLSFIPRFVITKIKDKKTIAKVK